MTYGFLVMTADGKMSRWSGKWSNSVVPPAPAGSGTRVEVEDEASVQSALAPGARP